MKTFLLSIFLTSIVYAQHQGELSQTYILVGNCNVNSVTLKYELSSFFGEPVVNGVYKASGSSACTLPSSTTIWLELSYGGMKGYVRISPTVPRVNEGYGYNFSGSPNWNNLFCGFRGSEKTSCLSAEDAKVLYKNGVVTGFQVAW